MKRLLTMIVLAFVLVGFSVNGSQAGVKKIRPDQLKVESPSFNYIQSPRWVYGLDSACSWTTIVKLPIGKKITKVIYYHRGYGGSASTSINLYRVKMGEDSQVVAYAGSNDGNGFITPLEDTIIDYPRIKSGYTYYVKVNSNNSDSEIHGIKIFYQD